MYRIHRSIDISFSHHVRGHRGPCVNLHGHTWKFEVGLEAEELDAEGFVVDFGRLKREVLEPCHRLLDHALAVGEATFAEVCELLAPVGERLVSSREKVHGGEKVHGAASRAAPDPFAVGGARLEYPGGMRVAVFPFSPTSERLAEWLWSLAEVKLADGRVRVAFGRVYETLHPVESVATFSR